MSTPGAIRVATWHFTAFRRMWRLNVTSSFVQPLLYLLGLGVGVGALVDRNQASADTLGGLPYAAFVAPGLIISAAMMMGAFESMWPVMGALTWNRNYHAIAATSLEASDIAWGHATWMAVRCLIAASAVSLALALFPDTRSWGLIGVIPVAGLVGCAFAMPLMAFSVRARADRSFPTIQRFVIIPLFLFGGAFYPLSQLPTVVQWLARVFPLWHGVTVSRTMVTGHWPGLAELGHVAYLGLWIAVGAYVAIRRLRTKLYS